MSVSQQVRETETWMPMKVTSMSTHPDALESSGDSQNGSDFAFTDDEDYDDDDLTNPYEEELSGSGDGGASLQTLDYVHKPFISFVTIINLKP